MGAGARQSGHAILLANDTGTRKEIQPRSEMAKLDAEPGAERWMDMSCRQRFWVSKASTRPLAARWCGCSHTLQARGDGGPGLLAVGLQIRRMLCATCPSSPAPTGSLRCPAGHLVVAHAGRRAPMGQREDSAIEQRAISFFLTPRVLVFPLLSLSRRADPLPLAGALTRGCCLLCVSRYPERKAGRPGGPVPPVSAARAPAPVRSHEVRAGSENSSA